MTYEELYEDVRQFLDTRRRSTYVDANREMRTIFTGFSRRPHIAGSIYRIYSRGDKQNGEELKEPSKIAEALRKLKDEDASKSPLDVPDILGLTIVCVYPKDIKMVKSFIDEEVSKGNFKKVSENRANKDGYKAFHYALQLPKSHDFHSPICEVQIKSVLHDAWAAKTHDLTYKPRGELDKRIDRQMGVLGNTLATIERQSEIIREIIEERWSLDETRKRAARQELLKKLGEAKERQKDIQAIVDDLEQNRESYSSKPLDSPELDNVQKKILKITGDKYNATSCRLMALLASVRDNHDMDRTALDWINRWSATASGSEKTRAVILNGLVLFCFGRVEEAIRVAQRALQLAKNNRRLRLKAKGGLAYYYTELVGSATGTTLHAERNARRLIKEILTELGDPKPAWARDTQGAVLIAFGKRPIDVSTGLDYCKEAQEKAPMDDREIANAFYRIHERRAQRRLSLEWD